MKKVELEQVSEEWLAWRKTKITASEMPIIMGKSKWCSPYVLWQQKLGFASGPSDSFAMKRGRDLEPLVREMVNKELKKEFHPAVVEHSELDWCAASLDGLCDDSILEIKCPGVADHKIAEGDGIPEHYKDQLQWQLFCADLTLCYYASYFSNSLAIVKVERDDEYIAGQLLPAALDFYKCIQDMEEPARSEDDFFEIVDPHFGEFARDWKAANEMLKFYAEKEKYYRKKLVAFTDDSNCQGYGISIKRIARNGNIDWEKRWEDTISEYPAAEDLYPECKYRKESIGYWKISEEKK